MPDGMLKCTWGEEVPCIWEPNIQSEPGSFWVWGPRAFGSSIDTGLAKNAYKTLHSRQCLGSIDLAGLY